MAEQDHQEPVEAEAEVDEEAQCGEHKAPKPQNRLQAARQAKMKELMQRKPQPKFEVTIRLRLPTPLTPWRPV